jgi:hypothetical protein
MADKTATGIAHGEFTDQTVATAGTTTATNVKILWDDADDKLTLMDAFERARLQFFNYLNTR